MSVYFFAIHDVFLSSEFSWVTKFTFYSDAMSRSRSHAERNDKVNSAFRKGSVVIKSDR